MDKSWMCSTNRIKDKAYTEGVKRFIHLARNQVDKGNRVRCPCRGCLNRYYKSLSEVEDHLFIKGIDPNYTEWIFHGEEERSHSSNEIGGSDDERQYGYIDDMDELLDDVAMGTFMNADEGEPSTNREQLNFQNLWEDARRPLYLNCEKFSKLSFIMKLLHIKTINNWSIKSFDMLLNLLRTAWPNASLPVSHYEARQLRKGLGFDYEKIHACKNDCILFWKEHENTQECPVCKCSRWNPESGKNKNVPQTVLRYFPLRPRLQRLFMSRTIAAEMSWHKERRVVDDNVMQHPSDSLEWKDFDKNHQLFANDPRNVRLGLASDGFNPFGIMSTSYSMWPVILMPYNLPPWKCMKDPYMMMTLLIPGPKAPGNDIDVYLRPLVDELNELWKNGVDTFDASTAQTFRMHAALLWTINDFPAYGNLSGWSTKGKLACPDCNADTDFLWLKHGQKHCYMGHRRFLPLGHSWRKKNVNLMAMLSVELLP